MNLSNLFPLISKKAVGLALNRVYKDNLDNLMKIASELSAGDVAKLTSVINRGTSDIVEANAILEQIIARHTAIHDTRVANASAKVAQATEEKKNAEVLLKFARRFNGTK